MAMPNIGGSLELSGCAARAISEKVKGSPGPQQRGRRQPSGASGMTAMTSTSTSHSGRASPATTIPVETG